MEDLGFSRDFWSPYALGTSPSALVPGKYDVSIDGRGYMLDRKMLASGQFPLISSIRATRTQSDSSQEPGEQSLTPDDLWRRTQQSWHLGAGQDYLDREDSDRRRFRASLGIDCWTENQISLLHDTEEVLSASGSNLKLMPAGSRLYVVDGTALKYTSDLDSWDTVTGTSGNTITGITSDGFNVWVTDGSTIHKTDTGSTSASSWSTEDADLIGYVKGRLISSDANELNYVSSMSGPTFANLFTHASTSFTWVGFAEGPGFIYAAGYSGDKSLIYKITITKEGTGLDAPIVAGELPDGEVIASIGSYLGFILLGTSKGARFCTVNSAGDLTIGSLIPTSNPVQCFEGQGEFIWFGWTGYDGTHGGLGRMSLRNFSRIDALKPAYASDLMTETTSDILSACTFLDRRVFAVSGEGIYAEDPMNLVSEGRIDCGRMNWGITEKKVPAFIDLMFKSDFAGTCATYYAVDGESTFGAVGTQTTDAVDPTSATYEISESAANEVEIRHVFTRGSTTTKGPVLIRHTVRAQPIPNLRQRIVLPIVLHERIEHNGRTWEQRDPLLELGYIESWRSAKRVVTVQVGRASYAATVDDFDFLASQETKKRDYWQGTALVHLKTI